MAGLRHPHIVSFLGLCAVPPAILTGRPQPASASRAE